MERVEKKLKYLREWQENVGSCQIGPGLSYQCEIEGVVEDTYDEGFEDGAKASHKQIAELQLMLHHVGVKS